MLLVKKCFLWQVLLMAVLVAKIQFTKATEIQTFGYLGYEGQLSLDSLFDDNFIGTEGGDSNDEERRIQQGNLDLLFHTFIYHPNFVKFDFGIGVVVTESSIQDFDISNNVEISPPEYNDNQTVLDYNLQFSFFEKKDYPFSLFYSVKHPSLTAASTLISETTRYGLKFLWNAPVIINVDAIHFATKGDSRLTIIDEVVDSTTVKAFKALVNNGYHQLSVNHQVSVSKSGAKPKPGLAQEDIIITQNTIDNINYDGLYNLGENEDYNFTLKANYQRNRDSFEFDETSVTPGFSWNHTEFLKSYYQYSYNLSQFADYKVINNTALAGLVYSSQEGISNTLNFSAYRTELTNAVTSQNELRNSTSYNTRFDGGSFSLNGVLSVGQNQSIITNLENVSITETINLIKGEFVDFTYRTITKVIKVTPANNQNIILVEGKDYELLRVNGVVRIRRLIDSNKLVDGQNAAVTYEYDPGRNTSFQQQTKSVTTQLNFLNYFHTFGTYTVLNVSDISGKLSSNQVTSRIATNYGAGFDVPLFSDDILIGAEIRRDTSKENITKTSGSTELVYSQFRLLRSTTLYMSRRHITTNFEGGIGAANDVNKLSYHVLLKIQPSHRTNLSLIYDDSKDVGSITIRDYTESSLRYEWQFRRILVNLTGSLLKEKQGTQIRERAAIHLNLIRTF